MSNVNIRRAIENIKANTTVFTPIIEVIVNAIQAIESANIEQGRIDVIVERSKQFENDGTLPEIVSFKISDNGIGFTDENRDSFDTLYSDLKIEQGGKGFGRFTCLKYFHQLTVDSVYFDTENKRRRFRMGKENEIIVHETIESTDSNNTGSTVSLISVKNSSLNKKLTTIARSLVEALLPYFITQDYTCPEITLMESDGSNPIILNDYTRDVSAVIKEIKIDKPKFSLGSNGEEYYFYIRIFKIYFPKNKVSKISLVADKREVIETSIHNYIPEFIEEFYDKHHNGNIDGERNYIIKSYVFSKYLNSHVSLERGAFNFQKENDLMYGISQSDIESNAAEITKHSVIDEISTRQIKKRNRICSYIDEEAPWHKTIVKDIDFSSFSYNPTNEEIESKLQKIKFNREVAIRHEVNEILKDENIEHVNASASKIVAKIADSSKNDLIHYIALRRKVLDIFRRSLEINESGKYSSEGLVHDIIFPMKEDSDSIEYEDHNLWIIDERLNFTNYVSSDNPLSGAKSERPDLIAYDQRFAFRGDNESSNPVTIFEFKKPDRDDFVNPSSKEDPVQQIIRYVNSIKAGNFKTPEGRKMNVAENTPFYGYVICDITPKVEKWLELEKDFKAMPDGMGWYEWRDKINLYIEVISWDKLLKDADMRNKIFFHQLGI